MPGPATRRRQLCFCPKAARRVKHRSAKAKLQRSGGRSASLSNVRTVATPAKTIRTHHKSYNSPERHLPGIGALRTPEIRLNYRGMFQHGVRPPVGQRATVI